MPSPALHPRIVAGIHSVSALLSNSQKIIHRVIFQQKALNKKLITLKTLAEDNGIQVQLLPEDKLNSLYKGAHQGVIAICNARLLDNWYELKEDLVERIRIGQNSLIVVCANIEDPRNLGACLRSAAGFNAYAVIYPNKNTCGLTSIALKTAAGAAEVIKVCQVPKLGKELDFLKNCGYKIVGLDAKASNSITAFNFPTNLILVVGGEDKGIPPHIARICHDLVKIPIGDKISSLNTSVALSISLYEARRHTL